MLCITFWARYLGVERRRPSAGLASPSGAGAAHLRGADDPVAFARAAPS